MCVYISRRGQHPKVVIIFIYIYIARGNLKCDRWLSCVKGSRGYR